MLWNKKIDSTVQILKCAYWYCSKNISINTKHTSVSMSLCRNVTVTTDMRTEKLL